MNKRQLERKIARLKKQQEQYDIANPSEKFTFHGGWSAGYIAGKMGVLEDLLDDLEEE